MALARAARITVALAAAAAAASASAQIAPRPLALYPLARAEGATSDVADVQALLDAALYRAVQRSDEIVLADPPLLRAACGPAPAASLSCLAGLAGPGLVLRAKVHRSLETLVVAIEGIDAAGRSFGPVSANVDAYVQNSGPLAQAILLLVDQVAMAGPAPARPAPPTAKAPAPQPAAPAEAKPDLSAPAPAPAATVVTTAPRARAPRAWMRTAGPWLAATGAALVAGGVTVSVLNRSLSNDLDRKFRAGTLTASDLGSYDRVEQYDKLSALLFASGGALTLSGVALWTAAPAQGRVVAGIAGTF